MGMVVDRWCPAQSVLGVLPVKKALLAGIAALSVLSASAAYATDESDPPLPRFRPWQQVWQCNDIRVTATGPQPGVTVYDLGAR